MKLKHLLLIPILGCFSPAAAVASLFAGSGVLIPAGAAVKGRGATRSEAVDKSFFFTMTMNTDGVTNPADEATDGQDIASKVVFHVNPLGFIEDADINNGKLRIKTDRENEDSYVEVDPISQSSTYIKFAMPIAGPNPEGEETLFGNANSYLQITLDSGSGTSAKYKISMGFTANTGYTIVVDNTKKYGFDIVAAGSEAGKPRIYSLQMETNQAFAVEDKSIFSSSKSSEYSSITTDTHSGNKYSVQMNTLFVKEGVDNGTNIVFTTKDGETEGEISDRLKEDLANIFPLKFNKNMSVDEANDVELTLRDTGNTVINLSNVRFEHGILEAKIKEDDVNITVPFLEVADNQKASMKMFVVKINGGLFLQIFILAESDTAYITSDETARFGYKVTNNSNSSDKIKMLQITAELSEPV